ncbi:GAF domain-containing protein [Pseudarthrobacter sp. Fe7]|nr:GAF domain-containing protein [Pseudarthrobacter sp. Fe7]
MYGNQKIPSDVCEDPSTSPIQLQAMKIIDEILSSPAPDEAGIRASLRRHVANHPGQPEKRYLYACSPFADPSRFDVIERMTTTNVRCSLIDETGDRPRGSPKSAGDDKDDDPRCPRGTTLEGATQHQDLVQQGHLWLEVKVMDENAKRHIKLASRLGLDPGKLRAASSGRGESSEFELGIYLRDPSVWAKPKRRHGGDRKGEKPALGRRQNTAPPVRAGKTSGRHAADRKTSGEHALAALGAAGKYLLTPEQAETERLNSLRETSLLRTGAEEPFDRVVAAAREFFNVGAASLSLIGRNTQHFKSAIGPLRNETPRQIALCAATVEQNSMLIINDALTDDRFSSNPLVVGEPHIRFYAGYPLHGPRGWNIGTLCIIDQRPRMFPPSEHQVLRILAALAQKYIDART